MGENKKMNEIYFKKVKKILISILLIGILLVSIQTTTAIKPKIIIDPEVEGPFGPITECPDKPSSQPLNQIVWVDDDWAGSNYGQKVGPGKLFGINAFDTIMKGINSVSKNGEVFVYNGIYNEHVIINKTLDLIGENNQTTIIDGGGTGDVVTIFQDNVIVQGFTTQAGTNGYCGIYITSYYNEILNNIIQWNTNGVNIERSQYNIINNNIFLNNSGAVYIN